MESFNHFQAISRIVNSAKDIQMHSKHAVILVAFSLALSSFAAEAANWYVRPNGGSYGSENGTDWNNAFDGFSDIAWTSTNCGDTIWVAGGNYTQSLVPVKKCTSGARLFIRRARSDAAESTSAAGWSTGFDSTVHMVSTSIRFSGDYDYITVSGRTTAAGGAHGWWVDLRATTGGAAVDFPSNSADFNTVEYIDLQGPGAITYSSSGRGVDASPSGSITGNTFSHLKIWDFETCALNVSSTNTVWEYLDISDCHAANWSAYHPNGLIVWAADTGIFRYSKIHFGAHHGAGEGLFFEQSGGCNNWQIYGNTFYDLVGSGLKALEVTAACQNMKIFNNTFVNNSIPMYITVACGAGSETRNNLFYGNSGDSCGTMSNNLTTSNPAVFQNFAAKDFRIVSTAGAGYPRNAGMNVGSAYSVDPLGVTRGADGVWDIGAFEFASGTATTLLPPSGLRIVQ